MTSITPFIVGNWKMCGLKSAVDEARAVAQALADKPAAGRVGLCPPFTLIDRMAQALAGGAVEVGAQDLHPEPHGAFTGDISGEMLADVGARLVIIGHSERRHGHGETDVLVARKVEAALRAGLEPIVCVGETEDERQAGRAIAVIQHQARASLPDALKGHAFCLAYEPVWAIGSGQTPSLAQIEEAHRALREALIERLGAGGGIAPILYGGSVKPANAAEILWARDVGGALVGGASLKAEDFLSIVRAAD